MIDAPDYAAGLLLPVGERIIRQPPALGNTRCSMDYVTPAPVWPKSNTLPRLAIH